MLTIVKDFLSANEVDELRAQLLKGKWRDGRSSAGIQANRVKLNEQLDENSEVAIELGNQLLKRLGNHPLVVSAAMPERIYPPRFNRYTGGQHYGTHVDSAVMRMPGSNSVMRSDLSATLFLSRPDEYAGGELVIESDFGAEEIKLAVGDLVLYPSSSLHRVAPVTEGERLAAFFWIQSMVRDTGARALLFDLDQSIQALSTNHAANDPSLLRLSAVYNNLVRRWAEF